VREALNLHQNQFIEAVGPAVVGFRICYPDVSPEVMGKGYPAFVEKYKKAYNEAPISNGHANSYDAAIMVLKAIEQVGKTIQACLEAAGANVRPSS